MRRFLLAPLALLIALAALPTSTAPGVPPEASGEMPPKINAATRSLDAVPSVTLDQTDAAARQDAARIAASGGYVAFHREREGQTGFVLLLHADSRTVLDRTTSADSETQICPSVRAALASA